MGLGLIGGALAKGVGDGGNKYIDIMEQRRRDELARGQQFATIDYQAKKQGEVKDADVARAKKRMADFQDAARAWRKDNPEGSIEDFATHFATTEYADLIEPSVKAAGLSLDREKVAAQIEASKARAAASRASAGSASNLNAIRAQKWQMEKAAILDAQKTSEEKAALLDDYIATRNTDPVHAEQVRDVLRLKYGADPAPASTIKRKEKTIDDETGGEVEQTFVTSSAIEATRMVQGARQAGIDPKEMTPAGGTMPEGPMKGAPIYEVAGRGFVAYDKASGRWIAVGPAAAPNEARGLIGSSPKTGAW